MREPLVLTIDFGTQSVRAMLFDKHGKDYGKMKVHFKQPYFSKEIGWAEQTPEFYWDRLKEATNGLKEQCSELWEDIKGVAVTTIRDTAVVVDKDGKPLRDIILWLDQREVKDADKRDSAKASNPFFVCSTYTTLRRRNARRRHATGCTNTSRKYGQKCTSF